MLVAINQNNERCIAWETEKKSQTFICPECSGIVILKKGKVKEHHFAHKPPFSCTYGAGESQLHYKVKREIYSSLKNHPNCTKCELERRLDGVYPDISLYINGTPVVIEVQKSVINIDLIMKRTLRYSKLGCYVLWVLPNGQPKQFQHLIRKKNEDGSLVEKEMIVSRPKQWEKYLHTLYFGRLYYWQNGAVVAPYHFEKVEQYVQESGCEWYNEYGEEQSEYWGGHPKTLKAIKYFTRCEDIDIMTEFTKSQRNKWNTDNMSIPSCKLWIDNKKKWW